jgi:hypothetical protein
VADPKFPTLADTPLRPLGERGVERRQEVSKATTGEVEAAFAYPREAAKTEVEQYEARTTGYEDADKLFQKDVVEWLAQGGFAGVTRTLDSIRGALELLASGRELSGPVVGRMPLFMQQMLYGDDPDRVANDVYLEIQKSLRPILGAQFTQKEGEMMLRRGFDPTVGEEENYRRVLALYNELVARAAAKDEAVRYYIENKTLQGYKGPAWSTATYDEVIDEETGQKTRIEFSPAQRLIASTIGADDSGWSDDRTRQVNTQIFGKPEPETVWEKAAREEATTEQRLSDQPNIVTAEARQAAARLEKAWKDGASPEEMQTLARQLNYPFGLDPAALEEASRLRAEGSDRPIRVLPVEETRPEEDIPSLRVGLLEDEIAGPILAAALQTAPTAGIDEVAALLGDDPEAARFTLDYIRTKYPNASTAGDIVGQLAYSYGGGAALSKAFPKMATFISETVQGGLRGAAEEEDYRLAGALIGGGEGALIGSAPEVVSRVLAPKTPKGVTAMRERGVPLSAGQTLGIPSAEALGAKMLPVGGDIAVRAQGRSFDDWMRSYLDEAGSYINVTLPKGLEPTARFARMQNAFNDAYDAAKANVSVALDPQTAGDIAAFRQRLAAGVDFDKAAANRLGKLANNLERKIKANPSGISYKDVDSYLGQQRRKFTKSQDSEMLAGLGDLEDILRDSLVRNSPADAVEVLDRVDRGYGVFALAEEAAASTATSPGVFTPKQLLDAVARRDVSARRRALAAGQARGQELAEQAVETLGAKPPTITPTERMVGVASQVGGGYLTPSALVPNIAMGAANLPVVRPAFNAAVAGSRPAPVRKFGEFIGRKPLMLASPLSTANLATQRRPEDENINALLERYGYEGEIEPDALSIYARGLEPDKYAEDVAIDVSSLFGDPQYRDIDPETGEIIERNYAMGGLVRKYGEGGLVDFLPDAEDVKGFGRAVGEGLLFGYNDEVEAYLRALAQDDPDAFQREVDKIRREQIQYAQDHPGWALAGNATGMVGTAFIPGAQGLSAARLASMGPKARAAYELGLGAGQGALYGTGKMYDEPDSERDPLAVLVTETAAGSLGYPVTRGVTAVGRRVVPQGVKDFVVRKGRELVGPRRRARR